MASTQRALPQRLRPPERVRAQWRRRGKATGERGYAQRWAMFWERTVRVLRGQGTFKDHDIHLVAEYVRRCRLAELHADEAEVDPYPVNPDSGFQRMHGGWERSLAEAREARAIAVELRLTPRARQAAGIDVPVRDLERKPGGEEDKPVPGSDWVDDQVGADGRPL